MAGLGLWRQHLQLRLERAADMPEMWEWCGVNDRQFLGWLRDRLVYVYGESPNVDFVLKLSEIVKQQPPHPCDHTDCRLCQLLIEGRQAQNTQLRDKIATNKAEIAEIRRGDRHNEFHQQYQREGGAV